MNCSVCGAMIPDGQDVCPNCGNPVQPQQPMGSPVQPMQPMGGSVQPMQPMGGPVQPMQPQQPMGGYGQPMQPQQPMGGYGQPMQPQQPMGGYNQPMGGYGQPMGGYNQPMGGGINAFLAGGIMKIVSLIGALFIFLCPLSTWLSVKLWGSKESDNMFGLGSEYGIFRFYGIMLLLIAVLLVVIEIADYVPALAGIKANLAPYMQFIQIGLIVLALLFVILGLAHGDVNDTIKEAKDWGIDCKRGAGPVLGFIGVICSAAPVVLEKLNINVGKR